MQTEIKPVLSGFDSLYLGFYGKPRSSLFKSIAKGQREILVKDVRFTANRVQKGFYRATLDNEQLHMLIDNTAPASSSPSVYVQIKSDIIWSVGYEEAHRQVVDLMKWIYNGTEFTEQVSRADLCADIVWEKGFDVRDCKKFVTRARKQNLHLENGKVTGFIIGRGNIRAQVYDKTLEIQKSGKEWFYDLWKLQADSKVKIWRVEFQLWREALKQFNIESFSDLVNARSDLWDYCTHKWLRMLELGDKRTTRRPVTKFWKVVQEVDMGLRYEGIDFNRVLPKRHKMTDERATEGIERILKEYIRDNHIDSYTEALARLSPGLLEREDQAAQRVLN